MATDLPSVYKRVILENSPILMQSWRPFVSSFVSNTYEEFSQRILEEEARARKRNTQAVPLFSYTPSAKDAAIQAEQFRTLQERVQRQRKLIKLRDTTWAKDRPGKGGSKDRKDKQKARKWKESTSSISNVSMVISQAPSEQKLGEKRHRRIRSDGESISTRLELPRNMPYPPLLSHRSVLTPAGSSLPPLPALSTFLITEIPARTHPNS
jgi:hypothetical protein